MKKNIENKQTRKEDKPCDACCVNADDILLKIESYNQKTPSDISSMIEILEGIDLAYKTKRFYTDYPTKKKYVDKTIDKPENPKPKRVQNNIEEYEKKIEAIEQESLWGDALEWPKENKTILIIVFLIYGVLGWIIAENLANECGIILGVIAFLVGLIGLTVGMIAFAVSDCKKVRRIRIEKLKEKIKDVEADILFSQKEKVKAEKKYEEEMAMFHQKQEKAGEEYKKRCMELYDLNAANSILEVVNSKRILSGKYFDSAGRISKYIEDGRADSIKEAVNLLVNEQHCDMIESVQEWHNRLEEIGQREQREAIIHMQEETARKLVDEARKQTEAAQRVAKAQEEAARAQDRAFREQERRERGNNRGVAQCSACANNTGCQMKFKHPAVCAAFKSKYAK